MMMRRNFLLTLPCAALATQRAFAHHGWSSFDETRPLFLQGVLRKVKWQNPHAEAQIEIDHKPMPQTTVALNVLKQQANVDARTILNKAQPPTRKDKLWDLEFAPLTRMQAWHIAEPKVGDEIAVIGYTFNAEKGSPILRVEFWIRDGNLVPMRSSPA